MRPTEKEGLGDEMQAPPGMKRASQPSSLITVCLWSIILTSTRTVSIWFLQFRTRGQSVDCFFFILALAWPMARYLAVSIKKKKKKEQEKNILIYTIWLLYTESTWEKTMHIVNHPIRNTQLYIITKKKNTSPCFCFPAQTEIILRQRITQSVVHPADKHFGSGFPPPTTLQHQLWHICKTSSLQKVRP